MEPEAAVPFQSLGAISDLLAPHWLEVLGGFNPDTAAEGLPPGTGTLLLIGPKEPGFWAHLTSQPEWDGAVAPIDRWSRRVIGRVACELRAKALFPFGGPPWHPFYTWALQSGAAWKSPVGLLVHGRQGLMVSYRGALALQQRIALPKPDPVSPCASCPAPCLAACPAGAIGQAGYDVPACHTFLNTASGGNCMENGCAVRRACPVSQTYARLPEQSAYHMGQFHK